MKQIRILALFSLFVIPQTAAPALAQDQRSDYLQFMTEEAQTVTASKKSERLKDAPGDVTVVTKDELERFGGTTLKDILERVPGLIGSSVYMSDRSMIAVRGDQFKHSGSHVLLLINGRPVRETLEGGVITEILESFPVNVIERIEVVRGPGSVLYGSGAFSGVINVITEKAERTGAAMIVSGGEAGAHDTLGKTAYKHDALSVIAAGRYLKKPNWGTTIGYKNIVGVTGEENVNISNKGPGAYLEMNYKNSRIMSTYGQWRGFYFAPDYMAVTSFPSSGNVYWTKSFTNFGQKLRVGENWDMDFNIGYTRSTLAVSSFPNMDRDSYEFIGEWTNFINPTDKLGVVAGGAYTYAHGRETTEANGGNMPINDDKRNSLSAYTQADYWLKEDAIKVFGGAQANKVENIKMDVVPRAGLILYPASDVSVKASYSRAFRAPSINELGLEHPALKGNPDLKSEKVTTADIGINYGREKLQCGLNFFLSKQTNIIFQDMSRGVYDNIGEIRHRGISLEGKYYANRNFLFLGSTLYQESKDKDGNTHVAPIANFGAKAGISYRSDKGTTVSLFDIYQGKLGGAYDTLVNPSPGAYNRLDLNSRFDINKLTGWNAARGITLLFRVDNLFDKEIWLPNWGMIPGASIPVNQGRTIYVGLEAAL
ncbi:MAG: hypothetical protein A2X28_04625 [Elusimicrobia bacterium GWA2_56_46]|nr:MAG: hypothetical protein A2X28_04625 [Elusimicrobia bacterium GWA2_56_46]OGR56160.1 MAG: hypothetical protein A2X39_08045 [Elusimicrobia bacterium GWC2_56_31]HBW23067.1 hypothetical protein [Elusimicrobiota bacterium]